MINVPRCLAHSMKLEEKISSPISKTKANRVGSSAPNIYSSQGRDVAIAPIPVEAVEPLNPHGRNVTKTFSDECA